MIVHKTDDYFTVINACYQTDHELAEKYHFLAPETIENCVNYTVQQLNGEKIASVMYEILEKGELLGHFVVCNTGKKQLLTSFFIMPAFRSKENVIKFWRIVKSKYKKDVYCALYNKNTRAIRFLRKAGFTKDEDRKDLEATVFKFKRGCP